MGLGLGLGLGLGMRLAHGAALVVAAEAHERGDDGLHPDGRLFGVGRSSQSHTHTMSLAIVSLAMVSRTNVRVAVVAGESCLHGVGRIG